MTDTLSVMTYENSAEAETEKAERVDEWKHFADDNYRSNRFVNFDRTISKTIVAVTGIIFIFGLPLLIIFVIFFFRYKNRKAKYRLAEQALASGQPLPESFFKETATQTDIRSKGIHNIFLGIGLFIFLWAITGEFGIGCIGLLVMFTGFGQVVIYYTQQNDKENKERDRRARGNEISIPEKKDEER